MAWPTNQSIEHPVGANVYGSAVLRTEPDRAVAEIGVARVASTAKAAFSESGKAVEAVVRSVRANNISPEEVEVSRRVFTCAYRGFGPAQQFSGYWPPAVPIPVGRSAQRCRVARGWAVVQRY